MLQGGIRGRDFGFRRDGLSLSVWNGRAKGIDFRGEPHLIEYLEHWQVGDARLYTRKGNVYLSVSFKRTVEDIKNPNNAVIGTDRGIKNIAVITDGKHQQFFGGGHTQFVHQKYRETRASLQKKKAQKNTRSLRRVLKRLSGREGRFQRGTNHVVGKRIVHFASATGNPTMAIEALDGIRDRSKRMRREQRRKVNGWACYQLEQYLRYKAQALGFEVVDIDPKHTSQACSRCGYTHPNNRHGLTFSCQACGYTLHADLNAARNIRLRGILVRQELDEDETQVSRLRAEHAQPSTSVSDTTGKLPDLSGSI
jgi:IS605 OrfB family transposase